MSKTLSSDIILPVTDIIADTRLSDITLLSDSGHNLVWRATTGGKYLALKTARLTDGETERNLYLLRREYDLLRKLDSPFIVSVWKLLDIPKLGTTILMEYVNGRPLDEFMKENPRADTRQQVLNELLQAIDYLHKKQIVHADLKPQNILVTHNGNHVKLIDLGLSDDDAWRHKRLGNTQAYAAPEQCMPDGVTDTRTDIYALGLIIRLLFPHRYRLIVRHCLQKKPSHRYQSVAALSRALSRRRLMPVVLPFIFLILAMATIAVAMYMYQNIRRLSDLQNYDRRVDSLTLKLQAELEENHTTDTVYIVQTPAKKPRVNKSALAEKVRKTTERHYNNALYALHHLPYPSHEFAVMQYHLFQDTVELNRKHHIRMYDEDDEETIAIIYALEADVYDRRLEETACHSGLPDLRQALKEGMITRQQYDMLVRKLEIFWKDRLDSYLWHIEYYYRDLD